ncbi:MAG: hypothetical protein AB1646_17565 [Thermodesulfobacteriota bacterium]
MRPTRSMWLVVMVASALCGTIGPVWCVAADQTAVSPYPLLWTDPALRYLRFEMSFPPLFPGMRPKGATFPGRSGELIPFGAAASPMQSPAMQYLWSEHAGGREYGVPARRLEPLDRDPATRYLRHEHE